MKWITKLITVPVSNATKEVEAIQLWEVRWETQIRKYPYSDVVAFLEGFPTEAEADRFAEALRKAFKLTKAWGEVTVTRAR